MNRRSAVRRGRPPRYVCVELVLEMHGRGHSFRDIARATGIGYGTVRRAFIANAAADANQAAEPLPASRAGDTGSVQVQRMSAVG